MNFGVDHLLLKFCLCAAAVICILSDEVLGEDDHDRKCQEASFRSGDAAQQALLNAVKDDRPQMAMTHAGKANLTMMTEQGETLLHLAVLCRSAKVLKAFLKLGLDPNALNRDGVYPIWYAAESGDLELVKDLHEKGADLSVRGCMTRNQCEDDSLLHLTAQNGYDGLMVYLLAKGLDVDARNNDTETPLHVAARNEQDVIAKRLVAHGASINARKSDGSTPLHLASGAGCMNIVRLLIESGANINTKTMYGLTAFHKAAHGGHASIIEELLRHGYNYKIGASDMYTPMHMAAAKGHLEVLNWLLNLGYDMNARIYDGSTPLHWAVYEEQLEAVKELVSRGASLNERGILGMTPLHMAVVTNNYDIVRELVTHGANVDARDSNERTAMHLLRDAKIASLLLEHDASPNMRDIDGETPLAWATEKGNKPIMELLKAKGAEK